MADGGLFGGGASILGVVAFDEAPVAENSLTDGQCRLFSLGRRGRVTTDGAIAGFVVAERGFPG